jgi:hypothetical protein
LAGRRPGEGICPAPLVTLLVRARYDTFAPVPFIVDTGADVSALPIRLAQHEGIVFPQTPAVRGIARGLVGAVDKYRGSIHVRACGEAFDWPCDFLAVPAGSGEDTGSTRPYAVLGRTGFLSAFKVCLDDQWLRIQRRGAGLPFWARLGNALRSIRAVEHSPRVPL